MRKFRSIYFIISLFFVFHATLLAQTTKNLKATQKWLKALGKEYTLDELRSLQSLDLSNTEITDAELIHLKNLKSLQSLNLASTKITNAGLVQLKELKSLRNLYIKLTEITRSGIDQLKIALPQCEIIY